MRGKAYIKDANGRDVYIGMCTVYLEIPNICQEFRAVGFKPILIDNEYEYGITLDSVISSRLCIDLSCISEMSIDFGNDIPVQIYEFNMGQLEYSRTLIASKKLY